MVGPLGPRRGSPGWAGGLVALWTALSLSLASASWAQGSVAGDRAALVALYDAMDGPNWREDRRANWLSDKPLSEWYGVSTDGNGRVTSLVLISVTGSPDGTLPAELGDLTELRVLNLWTNGLTGRIPPELGRLSKIEILALGANLLTGEIPGSLGDLPNLRSLALTKNALTGEIPAALANLPALASLTLSANDLTGSIPEWLGGLERLSELELGSNRLRGTIPASLANARLNFVDLSFNAGLSGPLPSFFAEQDELYDLDIHGTRICVPTQRPFRDWAPRNQFDSSGLVCGTEPNAVPVVDLAVFYTQAAREAAGGVSEVEAVIDLMVAETNRAYVDSGVRMRIALVLKEETDWVESGNSTLDKNTLARPERSPHSLRRKRDQVGADLMHVIVGEGDACGAAPIAARAPNAAGLTAVQCDSLVMAHELGHNMGLSHDRLADCGSGNLCPGQRHYPYGYGYVNQEGFKADAQPDARWYTVMAYAAQCSQENHFDCRQLALFSNPARTHDGDRLGVHGEGDTFDVHGPADSVRALNQVRHSVASFRPSRRPDGEPPDPEPTDSCVADDETLCLQNSRYSVRTDWSMADGRTGPAKVADAGTNDTGLFWFFNPDNWEVVVKVLDGCAQNGRVWVFGASTTDLGYRIVVTDTMTGVVKEYRNEPGSRAPAITDSAAFPGGCNDG